MALGALLSLGSALIVFPLASQGSVAAVNTAVIIGFSCTDILFGPIYTFSGKLFPVAQLRSGSGIGYHVGAVLGGGLAPLVANWLDRGTGTSLHVGYYLAALLTVTLFCLAALAETAPARTGAEALRPVTDGDQPGMTRRSGRMASCPRGSIGPPAVARSSTLT